MHKIPYLQVVFLFGICCLLNVKVFGQKVISYNNRTFEIESELLETNTEIILDFRKQFTVNQDESAIESTYLLVYPVVFFKSQFKELEYVFSKNNPLTDVTVTVYNLVDNSSKIFKLEDFTSSYLNTLYNEQKAQLSIRKPSDDFLIEIAVVQNFNKVWPYFEYNSKPYTSIPTLKSKFELNFPNELAVKTYVNGESTTNTLFESTLANHHEVVVQLPIHGAWNSINTGNELYNKLQTYYAENGNVACNFIESTLEFNPAVPDYFKLYNTLRQHVVPTYFSSNSLQTQSFYNALRNKEYNALTAVLLAKKAAECANTNSFIISKVNSANQVDLYQPEFAIGVQQNEGLFWMNFTESSTAGFINDALTYQDYTVVVNDNQAAPNPIYTNVSKIENKLNVEILPMYEQRINLSIQLSGQACLAAKDLIGRDEKSVLYELTGLQIKTIENFTISDFTVLNGHPSATITASFTSNQFTKLNQANEYAFAGAFNCSNLIQQITPFVDSLANLEVITELTLTSSTANATLADLSGYNLTTDFASFQANEVNNLVKLNYTIKQNANAYTAPNFKAWWATLAKIYVVYN